MPLTVKVHMPGLAESLAHRGTDAFPHALKHEIESLPPATLPLYAGLTQGGLVDDTCLTATVLHTREERDAVFAKIGIFFTEIVAGCSCGDEPMAVNVYCELGVNLNRHTLEAEFQSLEP